MFQLDNATVTIYAVANAWHKLRQFNALQVKQMLGGRLRRSGLDNMYKSWHANYAMWNDKRPIDDYNFYSLLVSRNNHFA